MDDLARVLTIRERRLGKLRKAEAAAANKVIAAQERLTNAHEAVDAYAEQIRTLEFDLLTELIETELRREDFARLEKKLKDAEALARKLAAALEDAAAELAACEKQREMARMQTRELHSRTNRLGEIVQISRMGALQDALLREDAEMDAFAETMARGASLS